MTSIRRFVYASLLAITSLTFMSGFASAQAPAQGKFTLTHDVRWANVKLSAGDYEFSFDPDAPSHILNLTKVSGAPTRYLLLVPVADEAKPSRSNHLVLETTPEGSCVTAMQLPEFGMTLHFAVRSRAAERQITKATASASAAQ